VHQSERARGVTHKDFDLAGFSLDSDTIEKLVPIARARRKARRRKLFVKTPLPWIDKLGELPGGATFKVAYRLLQVFYRDGRRPVRLGNQALSLNGVGRKQKARALVDLERLGLIRVDRRSGKSPLVTVIEDPGETP
jgi:hypothetical protein